MVVLKVSAQAGQSGAVNKTSVTSTVQDDDSNEIKRRKRNISNDTSQAAKKPTKPLPASPSIKLPSKAVLAHIFSPGRTIDTDTETTRTEKTLSEEEATRKPGRPPTVMIIPIKNLT
jgi:hypothetical protein